MTRLPLSYTKRC